MSEVALTTDELDGYVRTRVEMVLVTRHTTSSRYLHLKSDDEWLEPVCNTRSDSWMDRSIDVYPPNYFEVCPHCVETRFDVEVMSE